LKGPAEPPSKRLIEVDLSKEHEMPNQAPLAAPELNTEQTYLKRIDARLNQLAVQAPGSTEHVRMQAAREDVLSRMSSADLASYQKAMNPQKSRAQLAAEAKAEALAMEANKDKPAI
jgi:hypothetical protein